MSEEQDPIFNLDDKPTSNNQTLLTSITIITLLLAIYGKCITIGWLTVMLIWSFILPIHFIMFTKAGIKLAKIKNKTKMDYIYFFALCITIVLYAFTFVDAGDMSTNRAIKFIDINVLSNISSTSFFINIILIIIIFIKVRKKK